MSSCWRKSPSPSQFLGCPPASSWAAPPPAPKVLGCRRQECPSSRVLQAEPIPEACGCHAEVPAPVCKPAGPVGPGNRMEGAGESPQQDSRQSKHSLISSFASCAQARSRSAGSWLYATRTPAAARDLAVHAKCPQPRSIPALTSVSALLRALFTGRAATGEKKSAHSLTSCPSRTPAPNAPLKTASTPARGRGDFVSLPALLP